MNVSTPKAPHYTYSVWQFALSLLALLGLAAGAVFSLVFGSIASFSDFLAASGAPQNQAVTIFLFGGGLTTCALLLIPSVFYALKRVSGRPIWRYPHIPSILRPTLLILLWPLVLLLGYWVSQSTNLAWLLLPVLHVLAIGLPVLWVVYLAARGLPLGSPQRLAGVIASGLVLGPTIILFLEIAALVIFGVIGFFIFLSQPGLVNQLTDLTLRFQQGGLTEQQLVDALLPLLARPQVLLGVLFFVAVIVPMIEEAFKPIGVWLLVGFKLTPAAGFAAGAICGAGFAFFESLGMAGSGVDWTASVAARLGAAIIHIFNAGLMGRALTLAWAVKPAWAIKPAWRENRYLNLGLTYLFVVIVHGTWNGLAVLNIYSTEVLSHRELSQSPGLVWLGSAAPYLLVGSAAAIFVLLLWMNSKLRREIALHAEPVSAAPTNASLGDEIS